jgi:hypothetical protein
VTPEAVTTTKGDLASLTSPITRARASSGPVSMAKNRLIGRAHRFPLPVHHGLWYPTRPTSAAEAMGISATSVDTDLNKAQRTFIILAGDWQLRVSKYHLKRAEHTHDDSSQYLSSPASSKRE